MFNQGRGDPPTKSKLWNKESGRNADIVADKLLHDTAKVVRTISATRWQTEVDKEQEIEKIQSLKTS